MPRQFFTSLPARSGLFFHREVQQTAALSIATAVFYDDIIYYISSAFLVARLSLFDTKFMYVVTQVMNNRSTCF